jgi:polyferredoxin
MLFALGIRPRIDIAANADRNPEFVRLSDGSIRNAYLVKLRNMANRPRTMTIGLGSLPGAVMWPDTGTRDAAGRSIRVEVPADQVFKQRIYVVAPARGAAREDFAFTVTADDDPRAKAKDDESFVRSEDSQ